MSVSVAHQQEKQEVDRVLCSAIIAKAPRQAKLLEYICNEYLGGRGDQIKEYSLAVEVLGKTADFDQNQDAIVRVEFHRLRKKLKEYYEGEGANHALQIVIDPGHYVPRFVAQAQSQPLPSDASEAGADPELVLSEGGTRISLPDLWRGHHRALILSTGLVLTAGLLAVFLGRGRRQPVSAELTPSASRSAAVIAAPAAGSPRSVRILCGYHKDKFIDRAGNTWSGDRNFSGGTTLMPPPEFIARAADVGLYQAFRSGEFSYDIPLRPANYEVRLYFLESHYGPGTLSGGGETSRLFNVLMNGEPLLKIFDIIKDAGGNNVADVRDFKDVRPASDGFLHLKFESLIDSPILNAIEIEAAPPGKINPIRIVAQNNSYTDHSGNIWSPDRYYSGGQLATHVTRTSVRGTEDPSLFAGERFGNFNYAIPVAPGKYGVTLRFAETFWGIEGRALSIPDQNGSLEGGPGSRIFDVQCNGVDLLRNFDIFKEAGGPLIAVEKTFHNLEPNGQGKLLLDFVPVRDYASVNAVEVVSEPD